IRPSAIIRPLWSTTTAVTATSSCAAWACALRTIWIAFSPGIAIAVRGPLPNGMAIIRPGHWRRNRPISRVAVRSPGRRRYVSQEALGFVAFLFGPVGRYSTPNADDINECGHSAYENHEHRQHHRSTLSPRTGVTPDATISRLRPFARARTFGPFERERRLWTRRPIRSLATSRRSATRI